jgi:Cys-tRNA(Pro) deacylase
MSFIGIQAMKIPSTPAIHYLRENKIEFTPHFYQYNQSSAKIAAEKLGVDASIVIKTIVLEDDGGDPFIVLMHGDRDISFKKMARILCVKSVKVCNPRNAQKYTGYKIGGISPFNTRKKMPVYMEESLLDNSTVLINAGKRGFIVEIKPIVLIKFLKANKVKISRSTRDG